jgi:hypothetical protein
MTKTVVERIDDMIASLDELRKELLELKDAFEEAYKQNPDSEVLKSAVESLDSLEKSILG